MGEDTIVSAQVRGYRTLPPAPPEHRKKGDKKNTENRNQETHHHKCNKQTRTPKCTRSGDPSTQTQRNFITRNEIPSPPTPSTAREGLLHMSTELYIQHNTYYIRASPHSQQPRAGAWEVSQPPEAPARGLGRPPNFRSLFGFNYSYGSNAGPDKHHIGKETNYNGFFPHRHRLWFNDSYGSNAGPHSPYPHRHRDEL